MATDKNMRCLKVKDGRILYQIKSLEKLIARRLFKGIDKCENIGNFFNHTPTPTQMQIVGYILDNYDKEIYQRDLESVLNLRRATVSGVLQTMEKNGLVERVVYDKDARLKRIILNERARDMFIKNEKRLEDIERIVTSDISDDELAIFSKVLVKMKNNLENMK